MPAPDDLSQDDLSPGGRDPAEGGAPAGNRGPAPMDAPEESHLGEAGDAAEG